MPRTCQGAHGRLRLWRRRRLDRMRQEQGVHGVALVQERLEGVRDRLGRLAAASWAVPPCMAAAATVAAGRL